MFDIHTESHLRLNQARTEPPQRDLLVPGAIALNLALWIGVFVAAV